MAEIPEHLLKRSQEAKAKAKGGAAPTGEPAEAEGEAPPESVPEAEAAPAAAAAPAAPAPEPSPAPAPEPAAAAAESSALAPSESVVPAVAAAEPPKIYAPASHPSGSHQGFRGAKVPGWLYPVYVLIPILAIALLLAVLKVNNQEAASAGPSIPGGADYAAQCAACHGPDGGGGVGPALKDTHTVFPDPAVQFAWVKTDANVHNGPYGADNSGNAGKGATPGAMPKFGTLSDEQIWDVVIYERVTFAGEDPAISYKAAGREPPGGATDGAGEAK